MFDTTGRRGGMRYECRDRRGGCGGNNGGGDGGRCGEERRIEEKERVWYVYRETELERKLSEVELSKSKLVGVRLLKNPIFYTTKNSRNFQVNLSIRVKIGEGRG
ncbi:hypothetical protein Hanom_Chr12g01172981 [Helianthus anomalus]